MLRRSFSSSRGAALVASTLLCAAVPRPALAAGVSPTEASAEGREQAQARFARGRDLIAAGKHREALAEFEASADIVESPNTRLYIARCHRALKDFPRAYRELARTERDARALGTRDARYIQTADAAAAERAEVASEIALLDVRAEGAGDGDAVVVGDVEIPREERAEPWPVAPGTTKVAWTTDGRTRASEEVTVRAGERREVVLEAPATGGPEGVSAQSDDRTTLRTASYVAGGVAAAGFVTFLVAGALSNGTYGDLKDACGAGPCPPGREDDISRGKSQQTVANVGLAFFAISGAAAVTLFVLSRPAAPTSPAATARLVTGPSFVGLRGSF